MGKRRSHASKQELRKRKQAVQRKIVHRKLKRRFYDTNVYETFMCILILTFTGGFINAYTYVLHGGYLATMNTGNMARIGLAISAGNMSETPPYFMSIAANALGAMLAYIGRERLASYLKTRWRKLCMVSEAIVFICIAMLPSSFPNMPINFLVSIMSGFQLATFTTVHGNAVATTIASGNVRFVGENLGKTILHPSKENFMNMMTYVFVMSMFIFGALIGSDLSKLWGKYSICLLSVLLLVPVLRDEYAMRHAREKERKAASRAVPVQK